MNVSAKNVEADKSEQPKNEQDNKDGPKHKILSVEVVTYLSYWAGWLRFGKLGRARLAKFFQHSTQIPSRFFELLTG